MTENNKKVTVAKVISSHGIKGQVKVASFCKDPLDIEKYRCFLKDDKEIKIEICNKNKVAVGHLNSGDAILIAKISGITDRNQADEIKNAEIYALRSEFEDLESDDEFYYADLIGLDVVENGEKIGKVKNIFDFGASEMLEIEFDKENKEKGLEKIENFPFENKFFGQVDVKNGFIEIKLPEILMAKS